VLEKLEAVRAAAISDEFKGLAEAAVHDVLVAVAKERQLALLPSLVSARRGGSNSFALVIGNNDYARLPTLTTAVADAEALAEILAAKYGFEVTLLRNATRYQILAALDRLRTTLGPDDELLIFYSGHSELRRSDGASYWLPVDAELDSSANWIATRAISDILEATPARHVLVMADGAYGDLLPPTALAPTSDSEAARATPSDGQSRTVLSSGGLAPVLDVGGSQHSAFGKALLDALGAVDGPVRGQELHQEVEARYRHAGAALALAHQPRYAPIKHARHEGGDFLLTPSDTPGRIGEAATAAARPGEPSDRGGDELLVVDCRLPGAHRLLGRVEYVTPPRPARTSALECETRGGEYVAYSNANPETVLQVWLASAKAGEPKAATYVGEAYERGASGARTSPPRPSGTVVPPSRVMLQPRSIWVISTKRGSGYRKTMPSRYHGIGARCVRAPSRWR
jgi:hypothetical protein